MWNPLLELLFFEHVCARYLFTAPGTRLPTRTLSFVFASCGQDTAVQASIVAAKEPKTSYI